MLGKSSCSGVKKTKRLFTKDKIFRRQIKRNGNLEIKTTKRRRDNRILKRRTKEKSKDKQWEFTEKANLNVRIEN